MAASSDRETEIFLAWPAVVGAEDYTIYRSQVSDPEVAENLETTLFLICSDMTAVAEQTYYFWVEARSANGVRPQRSTMALGRRLAPTDTGCGDGDGILYWVKNARALERRYSEGFDLQQPVVASKYLPPSIQSGELILSALEMSADNADFSMQGGNLALTPGTHPITWTARNRFLFQSDIRISGAARSRIGYVGGWMIDPQSATRVRYLSIAFQKQNLITGVFIGDGETGGIQIATPETPQ